MPKTKSKKPHIVRRGTAKRTGKRGPRPEPADGEPGGELIEQGSLPGMEDAAIDDLENAARSYASVRDRRMALTEQEVDANNLVLTKMKEHGKTTYRRDGIEINIVSSDEKAKVRIKEE